MTQCQQCRSGALIKLGRQPKRKGHVATSNVILKYMLNLTVIMTVTMRKKTFMKMGTKKNIFFLLIPSKIIIKNFFAAKCTVHNYDMLH